MFKQATGIDFKETVNFIREIYNTDEYIPLHAPYFDNTEKEILSDCIDSTYVSSVGIYVNEFEKKVAEFCGVKRAVACVNGTCALHLALKINGIKEGDRVITQPLTFIATANAIKYCNAEPVFVDIDRETLGLSPEKLKSYLKKNNKIKAVVPMHTFGHPCQIDEIKKICDNYGIILIEDCAESLGSFYNNSHMGNWGITSTISFNGNKIITTGGGGMLLFNDERLADYAKYLTTQAKIPHRWEFKHSECGYNYRMPNLNAALGLAQLQKLPALLNKKRELAQLYKQFFGDKFIDEPRNCKSNFWLQAIILNNLEERDKFLEYTNDNGVMTRPCWCLMNKLEMFRNCECGDELINAGWIEERLVNIPSGVTKI